MQDNIFITINKDGKKNKYRILLALCTNTLNEYIILYTQDKRNKKGEIITYASKLDSNGKYVPATKEEYEVLEKMLSNFDME